MQTGKKLYRIINYFIAITVLLLFWQSLSLLLHNPAIPSVVSILLSLIKNFNIVVINLKVSFLRVLCGIILAFAGAVPLGLMSFSKRFDSLSSAFLYLLYPIPHIVLLPLFLILFGIGDTSKILLIAFIVFFQIWMTTRDAAKNIETAYIYSLKSLNAGLVDIYRHLVFPYVLPKIFTGLRISIGTSIAVLFFVESFATSKGLGFMIINAWSSANYAQLYAAMSMLALMGFLMYMFIEWLEYLLCRWHFLS